jgi:hypothetical protein
MRSDQTDWCITNDACLAISPCSASSRGALRSFRYIATENLKKQRYSVEIGPIIMKKQPIDTSITTRKTGYFEFADNEVPRLTKGD